MVRYTYGGEITHLSAEEQGGVVGAPLIQDRGPDAYPLFTAAGVAVTSFFLWGGSSYSIAASSINTDSDGFIPRFQVDDLTELRDAAGRSLLPYERGASLSAYSQVSSLPGYPTSFPPSTHTHDDRYYTETEIDSKLSALGSAALVVNTLAKRSANGQVKVANPVDPEDAVNNFTLGQAIQGVSVSYTETLATAPSGSLFTRVCVAGVWPNRGSARTDIVVAWISRSATDPAPPIGGTGAVGDDYWQKVDA